MVGRGADEGQAESDIDAVVERQRLDRDQRLIVIHPDGAIVARAGGGVEHGVGGQRAAHVDAFAAQRRDRRCDDVAVLKAERAVLAGMRVEPGHRDARMRDGEAGFEIGGQDAHGLDDEAA